MNKISMNPIMNAPMSKGRVYEQSLEKYFELTEQEKKIWQSWWPTSAMPRITMSVAT